VIHYHNGIPHHSVGAGVFTEIAALLLVTTTEVITREKNGFDNKLLGKNQSLSIGFGVGLAKGIVKRLVTSDIAESVLRLAALRQNFPRDRNLSTARRAKI
jgi:hypothetical protein